MYTQLNWLAHIDSKSFFCITCTIQCHATHISKCYTYMYVSSVLYTHKREVQYYQNKSRSSSAFSVLCCRYCVCMSLISTSLFGSSKSPPLNDFELKAVESPATDGISFAL